LQQQHFLSIHSFCWKSAWATRCPPSPSLWTDGWMGTILSSSLIYTLKYTVFNATLSFSFLFILRHISAALGHHQVFCCQSCLTVIYI
jgi:hypothetical protein